MPTPVLSGRKKGFSRQAVGYIRTDFRFDCCFTPTRRGRKLAGIFLKAALFNSSRPVLVLPHSGSLSTGRRVSIAWNQSVEAIRAVTAAMPILKYAEHVSIITCGKESGMGPKSSQLSTYLRFWGIQSERLSVKGRDDAHAISNGSRESESDLLVMGAYSKSGLRERIFGGVTEYIFHKTEIPVLMLHT